MRALLKAQICFTVVLAAALTVSAKRLVVFGDSISDNGNGKRVCRVIRRVYCWVLASG